MQRLFLDGDVYKSIYDFPGFEHRTAYAHIYYGTKNAPNDQHGGPIAACYQDDGMSLEADLKTNVLPLLKRELFIKDSPYYPNDVTRNYGSPTPIITFMRRDMKPLCADDYKQLQSDLLDVIKEHNNKLNNHKTKSPTLFASTTETKTTPPSKSHYDLRPGPPR